MTEDEIRRAVRWLRVHRPFETAKDCLAVLRANAHTLDPKDLLELRMLGVELHPKRPKTRARKGKGAAPLALFLRRAVQSYLDGNSVCQHDEVRCLLNALPPKPLDDPERWFEAGWKLYRLTGGPENDENVAGLIERAKATGEKFETAVRRAVRDAFMRKFGRPSAKS